MVDLKVAINLKMVDLKFFAFVRRRKWQISRIYHTLAGLFTGLETKNVAMVFPVSKYQLYMKTYFLDALTRYY